MKFLFLKTTLGISVDKYINRSNAPLNLQPNFETAVQIYSSTSRLLFDEMEFQLELDIYLRWCTLLWEQDDLKVICCEYYFMIIFSLLVI